MKQAGTDVNIQLPEGSLLILCTADLVFIGGSTSENRPTLAPLELI
jgi:hypothetical protein